MLTPPSWEPRRRDPDMGYRDSTDISGASVNRAGGSRGSAGGRIAVGGGSLIVLILALVAHEYGHHIQNLTGVMAKAQSSTQTGAGRRRYGSSCRPTSTPASGSGTRPTTRTA